MQAEVKPAEKKTADSAAPVLSETPAAKAAGDAQVEKLLAAAAAAPSAPKAKNEKPAAAAPAAAVAAAADAVPAASRAADSPAAAPTDLTSNNVESNS